MCLLLRLLVPVSVYYFAVLVFFLRYLSLLNVYILICVGIERPRERERDHSLYITVPFPLLSVLLLPLGAIKLLFSHVW